VHKSMDFLKDMRIKREENGGYPKNEQKIIERIMNDPNMTEAEKLESIKRRAQQMEKQAIRDEMLIRAG
jgi:hypothetical protein